MIFFLQSSRARARARRSTRRIVFTANSTTPNSYPHERRRVNAEEVHSMRPSQRDDLIIFRFEREADNFLFFLCRDDILSRGGVDGPKRERECTHNSPKYSSLSQTITLTTKYIKQTAIATTALIAATVISPEASHAAQNVVAQVAEGEPFLVDVAWGAILSCFSFSLALVVWGRSGL